MDNTQQQQQRRTLKVYTIVEKPGFPKGIWLEIGVASTNRDGSVSGKLDALPANGAIHIRPYDPQKGKNAQAKNDSPPQQHWQ